MCCPWCTVDVMHHLYERISRDPDLQSEAIDRQALDNERRAEQLGWTDYEHIVDRNRSAWRKRGSRPGFNELLRLIREGETEGVIVWDLDRLLRRSDELEELIKAAENYPVMIYTAAGEFDLTDSNGRFTARVLVAAAQKASDDTQRRIKRQMEGRQARVFGYAYQKENAKELRRMADHLIAGHSVTDIARWMNDRGLTTIRGNPWTYMSVTQVLTHKQTRVVIGDQRWVQVQQVLERGRGAMTGVVQHEYFLSPVLVCSCGHRMVGSGYTNGQGKYVPRYGCLARDGGCGLGISAKRLEKQVLAWVDSKLVDGTLTKVTAAGPIEPSIADKLAELDLDYYVHETIEKDRYLSVKSALEEKAAATMTKRTATMTLKEFRAFTPVQLRTHLPRVLEVVTIYPARKMKGYDESRVAILGRAPRPATSDASR